MYFFYYIPAGLDVRVEERTTITWFLAGVCTLLYMISRYWPAAGGWNLYKLVFQPLSPSPASALSYAFLHTGYIHLLFNMLYLVVFGRALEDRLGPGRFFVVFALSAMAGAYTHLGLTRLFAPELLSTGVVGASGATSGLLGAFWVRFYFSRVRVAYWIFMPFQGINRAGRSGVPVLIAILVWFVFQGVQTVLQYGTAAVKTAYSIHLGGFAAGVGLALIYGAGKKAGMEKHLARAREHFNNSRWFAARAEYLDYLKRCPGNGDVHAEVARTSLCMGDKAGASEHYRRSIRLLSGSGRRGEAEEMFAQAMRTIPGFTMPEEMHLELSCGMERSLKYRAALDGYENFLERYPGSSESGFVLLRASNILEKKMEEPSRALRSLNRLISEYPLDYWANFARSERDRLEGALPDQREEPEASSGIKTLEQ